MTTLYLKYRPQKINELDLADVRDLLSKIISSEHIPHAFLFEGPRGSGKTSAARIIAKVLNCTNLSKDNEPCNICDQCVSITKGTNIDVAELDAASHRGIDDVRLIRESVKLSPARAKKKVYIIDEAHMLTTEASNALLKTLEEPPEHVVFILATTNPEKLIDTIKSRTVRVKFKKASKEEVFKSLENVLQKEKKVFKKEVLDLISRNVDGSFRDAKKILEEILVKDYLNDLEKAQDYVLNRGEFNVDDFFKGLYEKDLKGSIILLSKSENAGVSSKTIYSQVVERLKELLFSLTTDKIQGEEKIGKTDILALSDIFISFWNKYQNDVSEYMPFFLAVVKWCQVDGDISEKDKQENSPEKIKVSIEDSNTSEKLEEVPPEKINLKKNVFEVTEDQKVIKEDIVILNDSGTKENILKDGENITEDIWKRVLGLVRVKNASTEALLRASKPVSFDGTKLVLGVYYKFHKEKLESYPHKIFLEDCIKGVIGGNVKVECFLTDPEKAIKVKDIKSSDANGKFENQADMNSVLLSETNDADIMKLVDEVFSA